jgi:pyruvate dehydrogenase E2 component (dihydrolipoamide acetyltransferase)
MIQHELRLPDLGLPGITPSASVWLVDVGSEVSQGDRVLEILAGSATVDLPAPVNGVLLEQHVAEEDELATGQLLATFESSSDEAII